MKKEIFKDVPGYEGYYQVSNLGKVKSLERYVKHNSGGLRKIKERILKQGLNNSGYLQCYLCKNGVTKRYSIHKLVAMAFVEHVPDGHKIVVDHKNNIKKDNRLENLQLITNRENSSKDRTGGTSSYPGVSYNKRHKKWVAQIRHDDKHVYLGYFEDELEASIYYQDALKSIENNTEIKVKKPEFSSKYTGVSYHKRAKKWQSRFFFNGKREHIGYYLTELDAHQARENFKKQLKN